MMQLNMRTAMVFFLAVTAAGMSAAESVTIVSEAWPPYLMEENGEPSGVDYEVMEAVFDRMGVDMEFEFYPWNRCMEMLKSGSADGILAVGYNEERAEFLYYPEEPVSVSANILLYDKFKGSNAQSLEDLSGKTVGVTPGYSYDDDFDAAENFKRDETQSFTSNIRKLLAGRIDYFIVDEAVGLYKTSEMGVAGRVNVADLRYPGGGNFVAFSQAATEESLASRFGAELEAFKETPKYEDILMKYGQ